MSASLRNNNINNDDDDDVACEQVVCYTAVFSVQWRGTLREDTKNGCEAD